MALSLELLYLQIPAPHPGTEDNEINGFCITAGHSTSDTPSTRKALPFPSPNISNISCESSGPGGYQGGPVRRAGPWRVARRRRRGWAGHGRVWHASGVAPGCRTTGQAAPDCLFRVLCGVLPPCARTSQPRSSLTSQPL